MRLTLLVLAGCALAAAPATKPAHIAGESHQIAPLSRADDRLRPRDADSADGTPIVIYPRQDWKCMTWKFEPAGEDAVRLVNYFTHKTFAPAGDGDALLSQQPAGKSVTDAERWRLVPLGAGVYRIEHAVDGRVLALSSDGQVVVAKWTGDDSQKWKLLEKPAKFTG